MDSAAREPFHRSSQIWKRFQRFCFSFFGILYWQFSVAIHRTALLLKQQALSWKFLLHVETVLLLLVTYLKQIFYVFPRVFFSFHVFQRLIDLELPYCSQHYLHFIVLSNHMSTINVFSFGGMFNYFLFMSLLTYWLIDWLINLLNKWLIDGIGWLIWNERVLDFIYSFHFYLFV